MANKTRARSRGRAFNAWWLLCVLSAGNLAPAARADEAAKDVDPFKARAGQPEKSATQPVDPDAPLDVRITVDANEGITFGRAGCPVIVCGTHVWNVRQGTIQAEMDGKVDSNALVALSDDGKYFAAGIRSANQEDTGVRIWSTETGAKIADIPGTPKRYVDLMLFSRNKYLILGGRSTPDLQVWDVAESKLIKTIDIKGHRVDRGKAAFSPDGELFVADIDDKLTLCKTATGKPVTIMSPPRHLADDNEPAAPIASPTAKPARVGGKSTPRTGLPRDPNNEAIFVYAWIQALSFSPDGKEIAAISTHPTTRLIVWDTRGRLVFDEPLLLPSMPFWEHGLQWLPDKSGWLVSGYIIDRESKRAVVGIRNNSQLAARVCLWDSSHLIGAFPNDPAQLQSYPIPWKEIRASIALMKDPNATLLGPAQPVSIRADLGGAVAGDAAHTASLIADALAQRLQRDGIKVVAGSDTTFHLRFSEAAGDTLPIFERQSPFDLRGRNTGREIAERKGSLVIELTTKGDSTPLWRETLNATSGRSYREDINDASVRDTMLQALNYEIRHMAIPYFIPKDERKLALPVVFQ
ncbi:MAG TPA: hypothetical protein VG269_10230 [Tepidisphaeraceae bacterium]|nr:hypothetical protein [Tepidisphaeraceae bacterium]